MRYFHNDFDSSATSFGLNLKVPFYLFGISLCFN